LTRSTSKETLGDGSNGTAADLLLLFLFTARALGCDRTYQGCQIRRRLTRSLALDSNERTRRGRSTQAFCSTLHHNGGRSPKKSGLHRFGMDAGQCSNQEIEGSVVRIHPFRVLGSFCVLDLDFVRFRYSETPTSVSIVKSSWIECENTSENNRCCLHLSDSFEVPDPSKILSWLHLPDYY
jgi:hypothetical protein